MECINCGSRLEPQWTHCPHCGKFKSVLKQPLTDEAVDGIFKKMFASGKEKASSGKEAYSSTVRDQVFEVIVRQAIAGAPWREICAGPMQVNNIDPEDVDQEVRRRRQLMNPQNFTKAKEEKAQKSKEAKKAGGSAKNGPVKENQPPRNEHDDEGVQPQSPPRPFAVPDETFSASFRLQKLHNQLSEFLDNALKDHGQRDYSDKLMADLEELVNTILRLETLLQSIRHDIESTSSFERELGRTNRRIEPDPGGGPHRIDW